MGTYEAIAICWPELSPVLLLLGGASVFIGKKVVAIVVSASVASQVVVVWQVVVHSY